MKKFLVVLASLGISVTSMAQNVDPNIESNVDPTEKYSVATNSFWSNWFVQGGVNWNAWYTDEEHGHNLCISPFKKFRSNPGISIAIGKWFTPGLGLRTKLHGFWGKTIINGGDEDRSNKYWTLTEDALFNVSNLVGGYDETRFYSFIPFGGAGISRSMTHDRYCTDLRVGILNEFRINRKLAANFEIAWNCNAEDLDGIKNYKSYRGWSTYDNHLYAEVGVTYNLGKATWDKTPDVDAIKAIDQAQIDALQNQLNDANTENARLKDLLDNQKPEPKTVVNKPIAAPVSVFFNLNETKIASEKDLVNVRSLVDYAKENNSTLVVTGYADNATGSKELNQKLSETRAVAVADQLVGMGVNRDNIKTVGKGGVSELSPVSFNRRVTIQIAQ